VLAGLIALAVGNEFVIAHPGGDTTTAASLLLFGGPLLYLLLQTGYLHFVTKVRSTARLAAVPVLVAGAVVSQALPPFGALVLLAVLLAALVAAVLVENRRGVPAGTPGVPEGSLA
jgi:low temperature requirement protein LtrA